MKRRKFLTIAGATGFTALGFSFYQIGPWSLERVNGLDFLKKPHVDIIKTISPVILGIDSSEYEQGYIEHLMKIDGFISNTDKFQAYDVMKLFNTLKMRMISHYIRSDIDAFLNNLKESDSFHANFAYNGLVKIITTTWYDREAAWPSINYEKISS